MLLNWNFLVKYALCGFGEIGMLLSVYLQYNFMPFLYHFLRMQLVGCVAQLAERRSLAGELTLFYARPVADG